MVIPEKKYYADSMAFLAPPGQIPKFTDTDRPRLSLAHLTSVPPFLHDFTGALSTHRGFVKQTLLNPRVCHVRTRVGLESLLGDDIGVLFGVQNAPKGMIETNVQQLRRKGLQFMALAYDTPTEYGDGFRGDGGLTKRGKELVEMMCGNGIILDLSHASHQTARDALDFIRRKHLPVKPMASHSGCYSVFPHPRNLPDDVLGEIGSQGGYVGIPVLSFLLAQEGDDPYSAIVQHVVHAIKMCGVDNVGIGSDSIHLDMSMDEARACFDRMTQMLSVNGTFGEYFPDRPPELIKHGASMFNLLEKSLSRKFSPLAVEGFLGLNFMDFLIRSLP